MHTRSAKNKTTGLFTVVVIDWNGNEYFRGEFNNLADADKAAADNERSMTVKMQSGDVAPLTMEEISMSDDELLKELGV